MLFPGNEFSPYHFIYASKLVFIIYISGSENFLMNVCLRTKNLNFTVQYYKSFQLRVLRFLYIDLNLLLHKCELHLEVLLS